MPAPSLSARAAVTLNNRALSLYSPLRDFFWWVGPEVKSNVYLQSICWNCSQISSVYGNSLLPQGQGSLEWCLSLPWLLAGCDKARATLEGLLQSRRVRMGRSAECRSRAHSISKVGRECSCWSPEVSGYLGWRSVGKRNGTHQLFCS